MKYKKLDNLDDLRVGDVLEVVGDWPKKIIKIDEPLLYVVEEENHNAARIATRSHLEYQGYSAKRPLPEKKVKRWRPGAGERYFMPQEAQEAALKMIKAINL